MLEKSITSIAHNSGQSVFQTFSDFLDYTIGYFGVGKNAVKDWKYTKQQNKMFYDALCTLIKDDYKPNIDKRGWCDPLGDSFMDLSSKMDVSNKGQFFTPEGVCDLMARTTLKGRMPEGQMTSFGRRAVANDCSCGSARNLLALHSRAMNELKWPKKMYLVGEDIDSTCVKMSAINMAIHGCYGEVVCHDTLTNPTGILFGYVVNETMWPLPCCLPSIRYSENPSDFYICGYKRNIDK